MGWESLHAGVYQRRSLPTPSRIMTRKGMQSPMTPGRKLMGGTYRAKFSHIPSRSHKQDNPPPDCNNPSDFTNQDSRAGYKSQSEARPILETYQSQDLQSINNQPTPNIQTSKSSDAIKSTTMTPNIQRPTATSDVTGAEHETTEKPATQSQPCIT